MLIYIYINAYDRECSSKLVDLVLRTVARNTRVAYFMSHLTLQCQGIPFDPKWAKPRNVSGGELYLRFCWKK